MTYAFRPRITRKHKRIAVAVAVATVIAGGVVAQNQCNSSLNDHVYHAYRLQVVKECQAATGTVDAVRTEADGDLHILVALDAGQSNLLTQQNYNAQHGDIVVEPICVGSVSQSDAVDACAGFVNNVTIPKVGQHVRVLGRYVLDNDHGGHAELHPVTSITVMVNGPV